MSNPFGRYRGLNTALSYAFHKPKQNIGCCLGAMQRTCSFVAVLASTNR